MAADPLDKPWGCYLVPAKGGGGLAWFQDSEALCAFVARTLWPALSPASAEGYGAAGAEPAPAALAALLDPAPALRWDLLDKVNEALEPVAQIHWWGSLSQLYAGEDPFAKDLREAWRDRAGRGPQDFSSLQPADQAAFARFLMGALRDQEEKR